jgi:hypothetical protein
MMRRKPFLMIAGLSIAALALISAAASTGTESPQPPAPTAAQSPAVSVKVYSLADLVAPLRAMPTEPAVVSGAQWYGELQSNAAEQLERLVRVVRLALPKEGWEESGGPGAIAALPERLSLVIRQTDAGHSAIADLLKQLRAGDDFEIELRVEVVDFSGVKEDKAVECVRMLGHLLSADELGTLRQAGQVRIDGSFRIANGRTVVGGTLLEVGLPRFTAVASSDRRSIELRVDYFFDDVGPGDKFEWRSQTHSIPIDRTMGALLIGKNGGSVTFLITPRIVAR